MACEYAIAKLVVMGRRHTRGDENHSTVEGDERDGQVTGSRNVSKYES